MERKERKPRVNKSRLEQDIAIGKLMLDMEELKRAINVTGEKKVVTDYIENPAVKPQKFTDAEVKAAMIMYRDAWAATFDSLSLAELEGRFTSVLVSTRPVSLLDLLVVRAMVKRQPEVLTLKGLSEWISTNKFTIDEYSHEIGFTMVRETDSQAAWRGSDEYNGR